MTTLKELAASHSCTEEGLSQIKLNDPAASSRLDSVSGIKGRARLQYVLFVV